MYKISDDSNDIYMKKKPHKNVIIWISRRKTFQNAQNAFGLLGKLQITNVSEVLNPKASCFQKLIQMSNFETPRTWKMLTKNVKNTFKCEQTVDVSILQWEKPLDRFKLNLDNAWVVISEGRVLQALWCLEDFPGNAK